MGPGGRGAPIGPQFRTETLDITYSAEKGADGMEAALGSLCEKAEAAARDTDAAPQAAD